MQELIETEWEMIQDHRKLIIPQPSVETAHGNGGDFGND